MQTYGHVGDGGRPEAKAEQPGRAGQQVPAGPRVVVDLDLDREEELGGPLDLVDDHHAGKIDEPGRVGQRRLPDVRHVKVAPFGVVTAGDLPQQRALPALPGAVDKNDARILKSIPNGLLNPSFQHPPERRLRYRGHTLVMSCTRLS